MDGDRDAELVRTDQQRELGVREIRAGGERSRQRLAHSPPGALTAGDRLVHLAAGFLGHPEGAVPETGSHVLGRAAPPRHLVIVDRGRAVQREVCDHALPHQLEQHGRESGFHDVPASHRDDRATVCRVHHRVDHAAEIARGEHIGERTQKRAERVVSAGRRGKLVGAYFVRTARDGNGADLREVRLG